MALMAQVFSTCALACIQQKGLVLYAYVIMSNPIHLIISKQQGASAFCDIMRDFKKFTSMQIIKAIKANPQESRKEWLLTMLAAAGRQNSNNTTYQFWQQDNHPIALEGNWIDEKLAYIHNNPVQEGWVSEPEAYFFSRARNYAGLLSPIKITSIYDGITI